MFHPYRKDAPFLTCTEYFTIKRVTYETSTLFKENKGHYGTTREVLKFKIYIQKVSTLDLGIRITAGNNVPCDTTLPDN